MIDAANSTRVDAALYWKAYALDKEAESDEELKLLAIQGLQHSDPEQAVPMLEKLLQGTASPQLKSRALFVLAQSNSTRARAVLATAAKGGSNPDVQRRAIQYLGVNGTVENRAVLAEIYTGSNDVDIKRQILHSWFVGGRNTMFWLGQRMTPGR